jgi:uncharacterized protein (TIGR03086 family)
MSDVADLYRRLSGRLTELVEAVPPDRWDDPSPCPDWSARDVFAHVVDSERDFLARFDLAPELEDGPPGERWPLVREAMQAALDDPAIAEQTYDSVFGPTTLEQTADGFFNLDLIVHGWDLARATGMSDYEEMPVDQLEPRFAAVRAMGDTIRAPGAFGPEVDIDDDDLQSRFLAFLGRRP